MEFETEHCHKCGTKLKNRLFACIDHWMELPVNVREGIRDTYVKSDYEMYELLVKRSEEAWEKDKASDQ